MFDPSKFTDVIYEVRDRAAWIIINRPKVYNAFRGQTLEELIQAFQIAANDPDPAIRQEAAELLNSMPR